MCVKRKSDTIMCVMLSTGGVALNVASAYAPQVECREGEKGEFWRQLDEEIMTIPQKERVLIGGDLNGHVRRERTELSGIHGGWGIAE